MRKCALPPELALLSDDQIAQLDRWLDRFTYAKVQDLFLETHQRPIGRMKLTRDNARRLKARALSVAGQPSLTAADLVALKNADSVPDARLNKTLLLQRTIRMVPAVESAYDLRELHQIATYEERRKLEERRLQIEEMMAQTRIRRTELRAFELSLREAREQSRSNSTQT